MLRGTNPPASVDIVIAYENDGNVEARAEHKPFATSSWPTLRCMDSFISPGYDHATDDEGGLQWKKLENRDPRPNSTCPTPTIARSAGLVSMPEADPPQFRGEAERVAQSARCRYHGRAKSRPTTPTIGFTRALRALFFRWKSSSIRADLTDVLEDGRRPRPAFSPTERTMLKKHPSRLRERRIVDVMVPRADIIGRANGTSRSANS